MKAIRLRTEYLQDPIGIDILRPRLSWNCEGGIHQTAYEIIAADDAEKNLWRSGKVHSSSMHCPWGAEAVSPKTKVIWSVRLWDENDICGDWSAATFETGIDAWSAKWITGIYIVNPT